MIKNPTRVFEFGDVVTIKYRGGRPGVVISATSHNRTALDLIVMQITTKSQHAMRGGAVVLTDWKNFGLDEPSIIKPIVFSYEVEDTVLIGHLDEATKTQVRESMAKIFGGRLRK